MNRFLLNPAVRRIAEQAYDGLIGEREYRRVAAREGLPLYVEPPTELCMCWSVQGLRDLVAAQEQVLRTVEREGNPERIAEAREWQHKLRDLLTARLDAAARERAQGRRTA